MFNKLIQFICACAIRRHNIITVLQILLIVTGDSIIISWYNTYSKSSFQPYKQGITVGKGSFFSLLANLQGFLETHSHYPANEPFKDIASYSLSMFLA